ncbi:MAG TPA: Zn-dependent hydrolase [Dehalococcoidia bacterium]|nr:Zn-dependent hydrolase [Dehalococcoidia bacterium]
MDFSVEPALVERCVEELSRPGRLPSGGLYRGVYTDEWAAAQGIVAEWLAASGLAVRRDAVGNLYGRLEGREGGGAFVTGSHIDTVREGGRYDGALGIIAGYLAVRLLKERFGQPRRPIEVIATCEEEGSRYHANFWGTRAITGRIRRDEVDHLVDATGTPLREAMRSQGLDPDTIDSCRRDDIAGFIELHIEQGKILETEGVEIGVVETITGIRHLEAIVEGQADHAGTTPLDLRRDAALAAAEMTVALTDAAHQAGRPAVATVGRIETEPGVVNIVAGRARFTIDVRHPDQAVKQRLLAAIEERCRNIAARRGVSLRLTTLIDVEPAPLSGPTADALSQAAADVQCSHRRMISGAGHDAQIMAARFPAGMIFVPSRDGRSHTPAEYTAPNQAAQGVEVLAAALHHLAY